MKLSIKIFLISFIVLTIGISELAFVLALTENLRSFERILAVFILAVIPFALIIWFFLHKMIVEPVHNLIKVTKVIATGNLGKRAQIQSKDELGDLAKDFNTIIHNLASGMQSMAYSLRDEKAKEKELEKARAKDEALLSSIGDAVIATDNQGSIILFNEAAGKMIGVPPDTVIGKPYRQILKFQQETAKNTEVDFIDLALKGKKLTGNRIMLQTVDKKLIPVLHTTSPISDIKKQISGVVIVLKDITRERELEKLKDEFVSLASHELRTPMTAVKGLISMILEGDYGAVNEMLKDPLSDIAKSTDRLIELVNDMLDISRIEAGRIKFTISSVSIPELVTEVVGMLKPIADQKNIKLEIKGFNALKVWADENKAKQILINLISNAIKFTDSGSVIVSYEVRGRFVCISITDSGIGICKENQSKLFGKFTQLGSTQTGRPQGTGLGLYISREFARKMGGELWIEHSEIGKGSTFTFALPLMGI